MNITALLFALAVSLLVLSIGMALLYIYRRRPADHVTSRLSTAGEVPDFETDNSNPLVSLLSSTGRGMERWLQDDDVSTSLLLTRAGWREAHVRSLFYILQVAVPLLAVALVVVASIATSTLVETLVYCVGAGAIGILAPRYFLRSVARKRQARVRSEVPIFIHMLVMLYDSGLSTRQALNSLVRDGEHVLPELNIEFRSALRQLDAGADLVQVLGDIECDLDVAELSNVLGLLRQIERYGGEIRESLLSVLALIEERRVLTLRERVNHMAGRMTVVMVAFFFPALLLCVAGPAFTAIVFALGSASS